MHNRTRRGRTGPTVRVACIDPTELAHEDKPVTLLPGVGLPGGLKEITLFVETMPDPALLDPCLEFGETFKRSADGVFNPGSIKRSDDCIAEKAPSIRTSMITFGKAERTCAMQFRMKRCAPLSRGHCQNDAGYPAPDRFEQRCKTADSSCAGLSSFD